MHKIHQKSNSNQQNHIEITQTSNTKCMPSTNRNARKHIDIKSKSNRNFESNRKQIEMRQIKKTIKYKYKTNQIEINESNAKPNRKQIEMYESTRNQIQTREIKTKSN